MHELIFLAMTGDDIVIQVTYRNSIPQSIATDVSIKAISKTR